MSQLWKKKNTELHPEVTNYIISKDLAQDKALLPYDIQASIAHCKMLLKVELITEKECDDLVQTLQEIQILAKNKQFDLYQDDEDCHTAIENYLVKKLGSTGKKIHTGRSRNDQVLVALRLFSRDQLKQLQQNLLELAEGILSFAQQHEFIAMPGYTHTQQAMPSSVGQWAGSFVESLLDDYNVLAAASQLNNQNPLGSAAGFGTALPIDREYTTHLLGFSKTQINALYCQNSRGKIESFIVGATAQVMMTLGKVANDLVWFTSQEFSFFKVDTNLTTGSSIMPQKRNLDIMEVLRANVSSVFAHQLEIQMAGHNLLSGYNKDLKITKKPLMNSFEICSSSLKMMVFLFKHLYPNLKQLENSLQNEIFATDEVNKLVQQGVPFREAYQQIGKNLKNIKKQHSKNNIKSKKHLGAPGNLCLDLYAKKIQNFKQLSF